MGNRGSYLSAIQANTTLIRGDPTEPLAAASQSLHASLVVTAAEQWLCKAQNAFPTSELVLPTSASLLI